MGLVILASATVGMVVALVENSFLGAFAAYSCFQTGAWLVVSYDYARWKPNSRWERLLKRYARFIATFRENKRANDIFGLILLAPFGTLLVFGVVWMIVA